MPELVDEKYSDCLSVCRQYHWVDELTVTHSITISGLNQAHLLHVNAYI